MGRLKESSRQGRRSNCDRNNSMDAFERQNRDRPPYIVAQHLMLITNRPKIASCYVNLKRS